MDLWSPYAGRLRVRACALIVRNDSLLLVNQSVPTRPEPVWIPPGGGVIQGERIKDTLIREVFEETHLHISGFKLRYIHELIHPPFHAIEFYYLVDHIEGRLKTGFDPEHGADDQRIIEVRFAPLKYLSNWNVEPHFLIDEIKNGKLLADEISQF